MLNLFENIYLNSDNSSSTFWIYFKNINEQPTCNMHTKNKSTVQVNLYDLVLILSDEFLQVKPEIIVLGDACQFLIVGEHATLDQVQE